MAESASAIWQLVLFTYKTARLIHEFARGVRDHEHRVRDLSEKIQQHGESLESVYCAFEAIRDQPDRSFQTIAAHLERRIKRGVEALEQLTHIKADWRRDEGTVFHRALSYWYYREEGGRILVESVLNQIGDLTQSILTELAAANILFSAAVHDRNRDTSTARLRFLPRGSTLLGSETEDDKISVSMIEAIKSRIPRDVRHQIKAGKSVLACDEAGWNSLHLAVKVGSKRILMELLKAPEVKQNATRLNDGDQHGETPLHLAARLGRAELLLELLHAGANVDALDDYGRPPLERAITGNRDNVVEILLRYKADERLLEHEGKVDPAIKSRLSQMKRVKHMMKRH